MKSLYEKVSNIVEVYLNIEIIKISEDKNMIYYKSKSDSVMCRLSKNSGMISVQNNITKKWHKIKAINLQ